MSQIWRRKVLSFLFSFQSSLANFTRTGVLTISGFLHPGIIELKKDKTPRDVVAQGLDYASWIQQLGSEDVAGIFEGYDEKYLKKGVSLDKLFNEKFNTKSLCIDCYYTKTI